METRHRPFIPIVYFTRPQAMLQSPTQALALFHGGGGGGVDDADDDAPATSSASKRVRGGGGRSSPPSPLAAAVDTGAVPLWPPPTAPMTPPRNCFGFVVQIWQGRMSPVDVLWAPKSARHASRTRGRIFCATPPACSGADGDDCSRRRTSSRSACSPSCRSTSRAASWGDPSRSRKSSNTRRAASHFYRVYSKNRGGRVRTPTNTNTHHSYARVCVHDAPARRRRGPCGKARGTRARPSPAPPPGPSRPRPSRPRPTRLRGRAASCS